ncbi:MAG: HAMP domain-containing protein, partial [Gemmatimonadales bacterium]|nr:HAMP domain-containing protein [Gemmatimonadales bacterium]
MNLNKLFPRLSIRAKLGIAFALVALVPLAAVAAITTQVTIARLRDAARAALEREVSTARSDAEQSLGRVEQDVVFLADAFLRAALATGAPPPAGQAVAIHEFLDHAPFLFRIKTIAEDGTQVYAASGSDTAGEDQSSGDYYVWRARALAPTERLLMPVEVRGTDAVSGQGRPVPAVAVIVPVRDSAGRFLGAVVGEAYAATLFASLEQVAPSFGATTTGLVDEQQRFLYHSTQKRNWESLLGIGMDSALVGYLGSGRLVEGEPFRTDDLLVSAERIRLGSSGGAPLTLFRAVPLTEINAPVREFLVWVVATGVALLAAVLAIALVAARQLTSPIYQLRDAASRLTRGQQPPAITIDTHDELEDLAADFGQMATALLGQQRALEQTVTDRTRELQQTHAELADVLAHSADAIVGLDPAGRIR